jgi:hypothetical protein
LRNPRNFEKFGADLQTGLSNCPLIYLDPDMLPFVNEADHSAASSELGHIADRQHMHPLQTL